MTKAKANKLAAVLYRREAGEFAYPMRYSAEARQEAQEAAHGSARVTRHGLVDLLMPAANGRSAFARLDALDASTLHKLVKSARDGGKRPTDMPVGLVLPDDSLGRVLGAALDSGDQAVSERKLESVRLWVKQRVAPLGLVHGEDQSWVVMPARWVA